MLSVTFNERSEAVLTPETEMLAQGIFYVRTRPLRIRRGFDPLLERESTFFLSADPAGTSGFYVWLPDSGDYLDPLATRAIRCIDLENAMNSLEYVAGGGTL